MNIRRAFTFVELLVVLANFGILTALLLPAVQSGTGQRFVYSAEQAGAEPMVKDVVCFTRGQRVYSFVGLARRSDSASHEQLRSVIRSLVWD